jgi:hypothetical protein
VIVMGWDPSTKGAAWACLRIERGKRALLAFGECESEFSIQDELRAWKASEPPVMGHAVQLVGVEVPQGIHTKKDDAKTARARGVALMKLRGTAAAIATSARLIGYDVLELSPDQCRSQIGMRRSPSDKAIKQALMVLVPNWPKKSNDHCRDAAVCALAAEMRWSRQRVLPSRQVSP